MDKSDILEKTFEGKTLATDSNYFRFIFKKTEKIVCAVFFILRSEQQFIRHDDVIIKDLEASAQKVMSDVLTSLHTAVNRSEESVYQVGHSLIGLESKLRILAAARLLPNDLLGVFLQEIDSVLRTLRNYSLRPEMNPLFVDSEQSPTSKQQRTTRSEGRPRVNTSSSRDGAMGGVSTRSSRVIAVLKDKGQATIKDVAEVITDCSEKTLQRELNSLIDNGVVLREGERRWSKYSLV